MRLIDKDELARRINTGMNIIEVMQTIMDMPTIGAEPEWYRGNELYVRDKYSGRIHRIGDDRHDQLTIDKQGQLHYYNLQNGDGCHTGANGDGYGYEFVCNQDDYGYNCDPREEEDEDGEGDTGR